MRRDLGDGYARAYWGDNLPRLMKIKAELDPNNIIRRAQSGSLSPVGGTTTIESGPIPVPGEVLRFTRTPTWLEVRYQR